MTTMDRVQEHYQEALEYFSEDKIVGIFLQGSQNYGLDYEKSDVDTKLIVLPSFNGIVFNRKPVSTTHVRANDEHIDFKDIRLYMDCFYKQNLNFLEILFTPYAIVNSKYQEDWKKLVEAREQIAHLNPYRAVKSMKGIAMEKYHAMEHEYPSKLEVLREWGYDPKQLHHLLRVEEYLNRYIQGEPYKDCLRPRCPEFLLGVKRGHYTLEEARVVADAAITNVTYMADEFCSRTENKENPEARALLEEVQTNVLRKTLREELLNDD